MVQCIPPSTHNMDCPICCETTKKLTKCGFCDFEVCLTCVKSFILGRPDIPSCMGCKREWNYDYIGRNFTKSFVNGEYKTHLKNFLFDRERARFPEAQAEIVAEDTLNGIKSEIESLKLALSLKREELYLATAGGGLTHEAKGTYRHPCAYPECRGFLGGNWNCGICKNTTCKDCRCPLAEDHKCDEDVKKTVALLKKDTRPCPSCGIPIHKTEGCDQMWCTECNTAFSWQKGTILTGNIHNPHFFEARRRLGIANGRAAGDVPCGGLPTYTDFREMGYNNANEFPSNMIRVVCYVNGLVGDAPAPDNMQYSKKFLRSEISEKQMKKLIAMAHKKYTFRREVDDVYRMLGITITDILRQLVVGDVTLGDAHKNCLALVEYSNQTTTQIYSKYGSKSADSVLSCYLYDPTGRHAEFRVNRGVLARVDF